MQDIIVVSDLHIGKGRNPETGRFHSLETFFYDEDMRRFLAWVCADAVRRGTTARIVFNGDTFDLLRIEAEPEGTATRREERFGADMTPPVAGREVAKILEGHPVLVESFADVVASGHTVMMLPGNHDLEVQWAPVQDAIRAAVRRALAARSGVDVEASLARFSFAPWFVHEPGRIWIEHGCQYDPENAYHYLLRSNVELGPGDGRLLDLDMPLGNFFQRYLYNAFGAMTFIVPSTRANARYVRWMLANQPRVIARIVFSHTPFIVQVLRRLKRTGAKDRERLREAHGKELEDLAKSSGLEEKLKTIDGLKTTSGDVAQAVRAASLQAIRWGGALTGIAFVCAALWAAVFFAINNMNSSFEFKALLFLAETTVTGVLLAGAVAFALLRRSPPPSPWPQRSAAERISSLLDVPVVTFGHTHEEVIWRLDRRDGRRSWYYNTGTWVAVFTHDELVPRERVQFTFLRMIGHDAELLHWSPARGTPAPVILLDELQDGAPIVPAGATAT